MATPSAVVELQVVAKRDAERLVFGYAVLATKKDGTPLQDLQGDIVVLRDLERVAYAYVEQDEERAAVKAAADETRRALLATTTYDNDASLLKRAVRGLFAALNVQVEKAAGGEMHEGAARSVLVESIVLTPEKLEALGIAKGTVPLGWWVGYRVPAELYKRVQLGSRIMFSIEGQGARIPVSQSPAGELLVAA